MRNIIAVLVLLCGSAISALAQSQAAFPFPNDPLLPQQWYLDAIGVKGTWIPGSGLSTVAAVAPTVKVVVMDSGIAPVTELAQNLDVASSKTFFGIGVPNEDPATTGMMTSYPYGHGSLIAGIIGAVGNNGTGIAGINWHANLVSYRVFAPVSIGAGTTLTTSYNAISQAFEALQNLPGNIIVNCSFSYSAVEIGDPAILARWKSAIVSLGDRALVVAAAGNSGDTIARYPATFGLPNVVSVGSINQQGQLSAFSSRGSWVEIVAPGEDILSTASDGSFRSTSGDSDASPMVAGVASLLWQSYPTLKSSEIKRAILSGASFNASLVGQVAGARQLNFQGSINALQNPVPASAAPVSLSAIVPAWTDAPGLAWGGLASAFGENFTDGGAEFFVTTPQTRLGNVSVLVGTVPMPLSYVGPKQINFQLPMDNWQFLPGDNNIISVVRYDDSGGVLSWTAIQDVQPVAYNPGFLTGADGKLVLDSLDGKIVLYAVGLGFTDPWLKVGMVGTGTEKVSANVQVVLDGQLIPTSATASARWAGIYEVRIPTMPLDVSNLTIKVGSWQKQFLVK